MTHEYKAVFTVDGKKSEQIVNAVMESEAKKLIEMQYQGHKIIFFSCLRVK